MNRWRVYLKPFSDDGSRGDWIDVSSDVVFSSLGKISRTIDNTEFDIGVFRNSNISISLKNQSARYSDVDNPLSVFRYRRSGSLVKITWDFNLEPEYAGLAVMPFYPSEETEVFVGILSDEGSKFSVDDQTISFTALGRESIFQKAIVPFADISAGDMLKDVLFTILNQDRITELLTVDLANIDPGLNQALDSIAELENKTVQEALNKLLLAGNSVIFIEGGTIFVRSRDASAAVEFEFFGQASVDGAENIVSIRDAVNGENRIINFATWKDSSISQMAESSVEKYDYRKREIDLPAFTNSTKRTNILLSIVTEFGDPKQEFNLVTPVKYPTLALAMLDRVTVDHPTISIDGLGEVPIWGQAIAGQAISPPALFSYTVSPDEEYKIIGSSIDPQAGLITFRLRLV
jgi:hypothetical protein